jgi:hypothetical protein
VLEVRELGVVHDLMESAEDWMARVRGALQVRAGNPLHHVYSIACAFGCAALGCAAAAVAEPYARCRCARPPLHASAPHMRALSPRYKLNKTIKNKYNASAVLCARRRRTARTLTSASSRTCCARPR